MCPEAIPSDLAVGPHDTMAGNCFQIGIFIERVAHRAERLWVPNYLCNFFIGPDIASWNFPYSVIHLLLKGSDAPFRGLALHFGK